MVRKSNLKEPGYTFNGKSSFLEVGTTRGFPGVYPAKVEKPAAQVLPDLPDQEHARHENELLLATYQLTKINAQLTTAVRD